MYSLRKKMAHDLLLPHAPAKGEWRATALRIVAVDGDPAMRQFYQWALPALGHEVCVAERGRHAVELCRLGQPDLVITEINLSDLDGLAVAGEVCRHKSVPFLVVSNRSDPDLIHRAADGLIFAYLVKPVTPGDLGPAIAVAMRCFQRLQGLWDEVNGLRQALEDRKLVERAKGMVMRYTGLGEENAYRQLRKLASEHNRTLVDVAQSVVEAGEIFHQLEQAGSVKQGSIGPDRPHRPDGPQRTRAVNQVARGETEHAS
jgi:response regulator NasT